MNPIFVGLLPLAFVLLTAPMAFSILSAISMSFKEKRFIKPWANYSRHYSSPVLALVFAGSIVLSLLLPIISLTGVQNVLSSEASIMVVIGVMMIIAVASKVYSSSARLWKILPCLGLALLALAFQAGSASAPNVISAVSGNVVPAIMAAALALLVATLALYKPINQEEIDFKDSIMFQRVIWGLLLANIIFPYSGVGDLPMVQLVGVVILVALVKVLVVAMIMDVIWLKQELATQLTTKRLIGVSILFSVISLALTISNLAV